MTNRKSFLIQTRNLLSFFVFAAITASAQTFTNPVVQSGQDPWIIRKDDQYYLCQSRHDSVWVNRARRLEDIGTNNWMCVWRPPQGTNYSKQVWAPELHFISDKWYIYVAADDGDNANHRLYVLEGTSKNPQAPFLFKGRIAAQTDKWAIDGTVMQTPDGKLYFIWAGWEGDKDGAQNLYIAPMSNPWTISGERVCISRPDLPWERRDHPYINEGPEALWHDNHLFVIYSASGFWDKNYCLGQLEWKGSDPLDPTAWEKKPEPVFSATDDVSGPGHCCFVQSPDGKEDWIVYHAHKNNKSGGPRDIRIQKFGWNEDGSPNFGKPVAPGVTLTVPSGE